MAKQGVLPFSYGCEPTASGMTALAGLLAYLELATAFGLTNSIRRHLQVCARQKQYGVTVVGALRTLGNRLTVLFQAIAAISALVAQGPQETR